VIQDTIGWVSGTVAVFIIAAIGYAIGWVSGIATAEAAAEARGILTKRYKR
jgi:hypothetical protein